MFLPPLSRNCHVLSQTLREFSLPYNDFIINFAFNSFLLFIPLARHLAFYM